MFDVQCSMFDVHSQFLIGSTWPPPAASGSADTYQRGCDSIKVKCQLGGVPLSALCFGLAMKDTTGLKPRRSNKLLKTRFRCYVGEVTQIDSVSRILIG
jgi:hypothetical protein